jgi:N-acetylglucosaminyl-diphospho-decaprenol L-rhamnosyltransferase
MNPVLVILVHWNRPDELAATVSAFRRQTLPIRLVIVDNGSSASVVSKARQMIPDAEWIELPQNVGFGPGMNRGLKAWLADSNGGEWAVLAPHDALPEADCLERLFATATARPKAGLISAEYGEPRKPAYHWLKGPYEVPVQRGAGWEPTAFPNGTLMAVRRGCLTQIGGFDERYFAYTEEYDLARRAVRAGWEVGLVWGAVVKNPIRAASSRITWYLLIRNQLLAVRESTGIAAAALLTIRLLAMGFVRWITFQSARSEADKAGVRGRAILDFWRGRFGPPPSL